MMMMMMMLLLCLVCSLGIAIITGLTSAVLNTTYPCTFFVSSQQLLLHNNTDAPLELKLHLADNILVASQVQDTKNTPGATTKTWPFADHVTTLQPADHPLLLQTCRYCGFERQSQNFRRPTWIQHLAQCTLAPASVQRVFTAQWCPPPPPPPSIASHPPSTTTAASPHRNNNGPSHKRPRLNISVRDHFTRIPQACGKVLQKCNYCDEQKLSHQIQVTMWTEHLLKICRHFPHHLKLEIVRNTKSRRIWAWAQAEFGSSTDPPTTTQQQQRTQLRGQHIRVLEGSSATTTQQQQDSSSSSLVGVLTQVCSYCGMERHSRQFQTTKWAEHLVGECPRAPTALRQAIRASSRSVGVQQKYAAAAAVEK